MSSRLKRAGDTYRGWKCVGAWEFMWYESVATSTTPDSSPADSIPAADSLQACRMLAREGGATGLKWNAGGPRWKMKKPAGSARPRGRRYGHFFESVVFREAFCRWGTEGRGSRRLRHASKRKWWAMDRDAGVRRAGSPGTADTGPGRRKEKCACMWFRKKARGALVTTEGKEGRILVGFRVFLF